MMITMTSDHYEDDCEYDHDHEYEHDEDDEGGRVQGIERERRS